MADLRSPHGGCPWDLEQDFASVAPYTVEEAYEVADAIAREDMPGLCDELGDLLFQVVFHAQMAAEGGTFDFDDVTTSICNKMIRRHPHVFGSEAERARGAVRGSWEQIKASERGSAADASALGGIAVSLPALKRAEKLGKRAAGTGFDWPDIKGVRDKVDEELAEFDETLQDKDVAKTTEELGDLLFAVVNLARHVKIDPEHALSLANRKFERRFRKMESDVADDDSSLADLDIEALEEKWQAAKKDLSE
jgi:ATP diphosphatase